MPSPLRVVVLGNSFAARVQLPGLQWAGGSTVVGIAGRDRGKAEATARAHGIPKATDRWRELLALRPDLVLVSTPVDLHREMTLAALEAGAAVLCEKPLALDADQAAAMASAAAGRLAWVDHELRWSPYVRALRDRVQGGDVGRPWHAVIEIFGGPDRERPWTWWYDADRGGGALGALGSHMVDLLRWTCGEIDSVRAVLRPALLTRRDAAGREHAVSADELALLHVRLASGATAELRASTALHHDRFFRFQVQGDDGCVRLDGADELLLAQGSGPLEPVELSVEYPTCFELGLPEYGPFGRAFPHFARDLVSAVRARSTRLLGAATFADGLAVQRVLDAARRSASGDGGWEPAA